MLYKEKKTILSLIMGAFILIAYCIYSFVKYQSGILDLDNLKSWANTMLMFIVIGIIGMILVQIIFHVIITISITIKNNNCSEKEIDESIKSTIIEDEMDKIIELKASKIGFSTVGIGIVLALISLALNYNSVVMLNIIFLSYIIGTLFEGFSTLYYYRKGIRNE